MSQLPSLLMFLSALLLTFTLSTCTAEEKEEKVIGECIFFPLPNFKGSPLLTLKDSFIYSHLNLVLPPLNPTNKINETIGSIQLQSGCRVVACTEPRMRGNCVQFTKSQEALNEDKEHFKSASCLCHEEKEQFCGILYEERYQMGDSHRLEVPGSALSPFSTGKPLSPRSIKVRDGCHILLWNPEHDDEENKNVRIYGESLNLESIKNDTSSNSTSSIAPWSCCYCDETSAKVCHEAVILSSKKGEGKMGTTQNSITSQFTKYGKKIFGIGRNYRWQKSELAKVLKVPEKPIVFIKPTTSYITEGQDVELPTSLGTIFYEVELGVVIGKGGKSIPVSEAKNHISGYFLALDMTGKEFIKNSGGQSLPWTIGKGFDTACPVSNFIPKAMIPDPDEVDLECRINGVVTQQDNTRNMIFNVSTLISYISKYITLEPYDTIVTGTPDGLGPVKNGDVIYARLGNITEMRFRVRNAVEA